MDGELAHVEWIKGILPIWVQQFEKHANDYGDAVNVLGARGQFADMHRKMGKLYNALWLGEELETESVEEIVDDLVGHCLLTLYFLANPTVDGVQGFYNELS